MTKSNLKVQNIVATASFGKPIPLVKLARSQPNTEYNPEQFPGLVLRIKMLDKGKVISETEIQL